MEIQEINQEQANAIISNYAPKGLFWFKEKEHYVAIDNSSGEAWTEDFKTFDEVINYLNGESTRENNWKLKFICNECGNEYIREEEPTKCSCGYDNFGIEDLLDDKVEIKTIKIKDKVNFPKGKWVNIVHAKFEHRISNDLDETIYFYVEDDLDFNSLKVGEEIELDEKFIIIEVE